METLKMTGASSASEDTMEAPADARDTNTRDSTDVSEVSSTEPTDAKSPTDTSAVDGTTGEKKPSEDAKGPQTLLEAVELATKSIADADPSPAESEQEKTATEAKPEDGETEAGKEEEAPPPFHEHPRWKSLLSERDELVTERDTLKTEAVTLKEDSEAIGRLSTFMEEQQISAENVNELLQIGGLLKNDPAKALEAIRPTYEKLLALTGETLPADLIRAVDDGEITEEYARRLAAAQSTGQVQEARTEQLVTRQQEQTVVRDKETASAAFSTEAGAWEASWKASDPDYSLKQKRMHEKVELAIFRQQIPQDPTKVRAKLDELRKEVETDMRSMQPAKKKISSGPEGSGSNSTSRAGPKTLMEAMEAAVSG